MRLTAVVSKNGIEYICQLIILVIYYVRNSHFFFLLIQEPKNP